MNVDCYLKIRATRTGYGAEENDSYFKGTALSVSKNKPKTESDEVAIKLKLQIPNALFLKPSLSFDLKVPENQTLSNEISLESQENLADMLSRQLGQKVHLAISCDED